MPIKIFWFFILVNAYLNLFVCTIAKSFKPTMTIGRYSRHTNALNDAKLKKNSRATETGLIESMFIS